MKISSIQNAICGIKVPSTTVPQTQESPVSHGNLALDTVATPNVEQSAQPILVKPVERVTGQQVESIQDLVKSFREGVEVMHLPKVGKKILLRQGALRIIKFYGYKVHTELINTTFDPSQQFISYTFKAVVVTAEGEFVAEAIGAASSAEKKFGGTLASNPMVASMAAKRAIVAVAKDLLV